MTLRIACARRLHGGDPQRHVGSTWSRAWKRRLHGRPPLVAQETKTEENRLSKLSCGSSIDETNLRRERERERDMCVYMKCILVHKAKHVSGIVHGVFIYIYIYVYTEMHKGSIRHPTRDAIRDATRDVTRDAMR